MSLSQAMGGPSVPQDFAPPMMTMTADGTFQNVQWAQGAPPMTSKAPQQAEAAVAMEVAPSLVGSIVEPALPTHTFSVQFVANFEDGAGRTVYEIEVTGPDGACWTIQKRYSEVRELYDLVKLYLNDRLPPIPGKTLFGNRNPVFIAERQTGLQRCLNGTLQLVASQKPSILGYVSSFLGCAEQTGRGRTLVATDRRQTCNNRQLHVDSSAPPARTAARLCHPDTIPPPRAVSLEGRTSVGQWHKRTAERSMTPMRAEGTPARQQTHLLTRSMTPMRSVSTTSHSIPPHASEIPSDHVQRPRRWSRRHQPQQAVGQSATGSCVAETQNLVGTQGRGVVAELPMAGEMRCAAAQSSADTGAGTPRSSTECREAAEHGKVVAEGESAAGSARVTEVRGEVSEAQNATSCPGHVEPVPETPPRPAASFRTSPSPAPHGDSWDWPLSRPEKRERVRLIDRDIAHMDHEILKDELEQLRSARGSRTDTPSKRPSV